MADPVAPTEAPRPPRDAVGALNREFFRAYPVEAARRLEPLAPAALAALLSQQAPEDLVGLFEHLAADLGAHALVHLDRATAGDILRRLTPARVTALLAQMDDDEREDLLAALGGGLAGELRQLLAYEPETAGRLMETRIPVFRRDTTVEEALARLRDAKVKGLHMLFLADDADRLAARATLHDVAVAELGTRLGDVAVPVEAAVRATDPQEEVVELLEKHRLPNVPVIDADGRLIGVVRYASLMTALEEEASVDIQTMVGASKDERALSPALFAVRKRLPWLQVNLLTAFLAAAVVGLFEETIAAFTALAVLLPVVAGQSGNAGAQALAVTMRGLALREITPRQWARVTSKEVMVGLLNGVAVALTCGIGVWIWSGSFGLTLVIFSSMILAMVAAGFAGAVVPIALRKLGQDPAQSSSIVLTTVTDVAGFFSFLGIATLLASLL